MDMAIRSPFDHIANAGSRHAMLPRKISLTRLSAKHGAKNFDSLFVSKLGVVDLLTLVVGSIATLCSAVSIVIGPRSYPQVFGVYAGRVITGMAYRFAFRYRAIEQAVRHTVSQSLSFATKGMFTGSVSLRGGVPSPVPARIFVNDVFGMKSLNVVFKSHSGSPVIVTENGTTKGEACHGR
jgi:hypothetical protein